MPRDRVDDRGTPPLAALPASDERPGAGSANAALRGGPGDGTAFDRALLATPKADLHVHLVGSAAPRTVTTLARRHPGAGVPADEASLAESYRFRDFAHFLDVYTTVSSLIRDETDLLALVEGLGTDLQGQGAVYAEVTVTPSTHLAAGIPLAGLADALTVGAARVARETGVVLRWVYDCSGGEGPDGAELMLEAALRHPPAGLVGVGVGGAEAGVRRADFAGVFARARAAGLAALPHAGETAGPAEVWAAVDALGARRVGHGIAAARDATLLQYLAERGTVLEVCLSSNLATRAVPSLEEHPLPALLAAGVAVVLGSDDPPMFGTDLATEYRLARERLGMDTAALLHLASSSIDHAVDLDAARAAAQRSAALHLTADRDRPIPQA